MYISDIRVDNFGPIKHLHFHFRPQGINLIAGHNATGKTQLLASVYAMFFGDKILRHNEESNETGNVVLQVTLPRGKITLTNRYTNALTQMYVDSFDKLLEASNINREELYFYFPYNFDREKRVYTKEMIRLSYKFLCDLGLQSHHILGTCLAKRETNVFMSVAEERYIELIYFLSQLPENAVFLGDSILSAFDKSMRNMVLSVLHRMTNCQFILTENPNIIDECIAYNIERFDLAIPSDFRSPVSYNYSKIPPRYPQIKSEGDGHQDDNDLIVPIIFCIDKLFPYEECKEIELKEIKGRNPCASIIANAEIYINAYLNSTSKDLGRIFWGVNDNRLIKGVILSYQDKDIIQKRIAEALSQAQPYISPDLYFIKFNQVFTEGGEIKIGVTPCQSNRLFSTSKGDVYIKTAGGKEKLTALQIQEQILLRTGGRYIKK